MERYLLILGAMKCGTTALFQALRQHPEILPSAEKEPAYWIQEEARQQGLAGFRPLWAHHGPNPTAWRMEASTGYAKIPVRPSPAPVLAGQDAEFRFIYVTRNPLERIRSQYEHSLAEGWFKKPIHEFLHPAAVWFSKYHLQLQPFVDWFGKERIHVLSYEELCADAGTALQGIANFLEIDAGAMPPGLPRANDSRGYRNKRTAQTQVKGSHDGGLQQRLDRDVTPTPEQASFIREALAEDLAAFEREWGIDPWTGERTNRGAVDQVPGLFGRTPIEAQR